MPPKTFAAFTIEAMVGCGEGGGGGVGIVTVTVAEPNEPPKLVAPPYCAVIVFVPVVNWLPETVIVAVDEFGPALRSCEVLNDLLPTLNETAPEGMFAEMAVTVAVTSVLPFKVMLVGLAATEVMVGCGEDGGGGVEVCVP